MVGEGNARVISAYSLILNNWVVMFQKLIQNIQILFIILISILGPVLFFRSEEKEFVFAQKAETHAVVQSIFEIDSLYSGYIMDLQIENENLKDTIISYTSYYEIGDTLELLYKKSDPALFRYKSEFDYFDSVSPLFYPLIIIVPLLLSAIQKRKRKKSPPQKSVETKKVGFNDLDLDSNFTCDMIKSFVGIEKTGFILGVILAVPFLIVYTVAVFVLSDGSSVQMLREYWMVVGFAFSFLILKIAVQSRMPIRVTANSDTVSIQLLWKKEVIEVKRDIVEMKLGSKLIFMKPKLNIKIDGHLFHYRMEGVKYITEPLNEYEDLC